MSIKSKINTIKFFFKKKRIIVMCRVFYGEEWMELALKNVEPYVYKILILKSNSTWNDTDYSSDDVKPIIDRLNENSGKYVYMERDWGDQWQQQDAAWYLIRKEYPEATHMLFLDTDEIYEPVDIKKLVGYCRSISYFNKALRVNMYTYIKKVYYRVYPLEIYKPIAIIPVLDYIHFSGIRDIDGAPKCTVDVYMHHFSLVRISDERIRKKMNKCGINKYEHVENWYENIYLPLNENTKNFHTIKGNESQWASVEVVASDKLPEGVEEIYKSWNKEC